MFTGIIESTGIVKEISSSGSNKSFWIESPLSAEFKIDQSIAHNGVCLTVEEILGGQYKVTAVAETLAKTALHQWKIGSVINLERSLLPIKPVGRPFCTGPRRYHRHLQKNKGQAGQL